MANEDKRLPRGRWFGPLQLAHLVRIGIYGTLFVTIILIREPCAEGVGRTFDALVGHEPEPPAESRPPLVEGEMEYIRLTDEEIRKKRFGGDAEGPRAADCDKLDRHGCLQSPSCSLVLPEARKPYTCRRARPPCETAVVQAHLTNAPGSGQTVESATAAQKRCADLEGCLYDPGGCYCNCRGYGKTTIEDESGPVCLCACSGGPPPICRSAP